MYARKQRAPRRRPVDASRRRRRGRRPERRGGTAAEVSDRRPRGRSVRRSTWPRPSSRRPATSCHQPLVGRDGSLAGVEALLRWDDQRPRRGRARCGSCRPPPTTTWPPPSAAGCGARRSPTARRWLGARRPASPAVPVHVNVAGSRAGARRASSTTLLGRPRRGRRRARRPGARGARARTWPTPPPAPSSPTSPAGLAGPRRGRRPGRPAARRAGRAAGPGHQARPGPGRPASTRTTRSASRSSGRSCLLAHGLGWRSLAVGVETEHQRAVLFGFGVDAVQGRASTMPLERDELRRRGWSARLGRPGRGPLRNVRP